MAVDVAVTIEAQLTPGTWTNLTPDVVIADGVRWNYGIDGSGPLDCVASTGTLTFTLRNDPSNSGATQGWYSPSHASARSGWTFGIPIRVVVSGQVQSSVVSITRSGSTATVTTTDPHGLSTGQSITISGATPTSYNGTFQITVTGASTFTYSLAGGVGDFVASLPLLFASPTVPSTPAGGTLLFLQAFTKFRGKVREIRPDAGVSRSQKVSVVAYDGMRDLLEARARELDLAIDTAEDTLIGAVLDAVPTDAQPISRSLDSGVDTFPYAFDNVGDGLQAGSLIKDIAQSSYGWAFITGDGTFRYLNRHNKATSASTFTVSNTMQDVQGPSSLDGVFNRVRTTIHPKTVDETATTVLYALSGQPPQIGPLATVTIWGDYRDPNDTQRLIGGADAQTPLIPMQDYIANAASDGGGLDKTGSVTITATPFASTVKFEIANAGEVPVFLTTLQLRGKGIYDDGPQTFEKYTEQDYGDRPVDIDLPYQDNHFIGQSAADFIQRQYESLGLQVDSLSLVANTDSTFLTQVLTREPGDRITVSETVSGVTSVDSLIRRVECEVAPGPVVTCHWGLAPAGPANNWWALGVAGASELGTTTVLGF